MAGMYFTKINMDTQFILRTVDPSVYPTWSWADDDAGIEGGKKTTLKASHVMDLRARVKDLATKLIVCACTCECTVTCPCTCECTCTCTCDWCFG